ncbi:RNA polymerase sigma factor [uncultured Jatrophihabitans sp.]|uniref:RNA polymerase sigma factor n=1 Tax=uncultured Jatrophihabitans sp. TaxID=1610747 RepID=UPI0035CADCFD
MTDEPLPRLRTPPVVADPAPHGSAGDPTADNAFPQLIASARAGDQDAFAALYRDLHPRLLRYASVLVGQDAEDVVADAWLQIARDLERFDGDLLQFRAWTARIVRNRAIDHVRAQARRPQRAAGLDAVADRPSPDDTAESAADAISTSAAISLIASLPRNQAEAVLLRAVVGLDPAGAGKVLGKRPGAVRVAAHRGLRALEEQLRRSDARGERS